VQDLLSFLYNFNCTSYIEGFFVIHQDTFRASLNFEEKEQVATSFASGIILGNLQPTVKNFNWDRDPTLYQILGCQMHIGL